MLMLPGMWPGSVPEGGLQNYVHKFNRADEKVMPFFFFLKHATGTKFKMTHFSKKKKKNNKISHFKHFICCLCTIFNQI